MFTLAKRKFEEETGLPWSDPSYLLWLEKLVEEKFTSTNKAMPKCACGRDGFGSLCKVCWENYLECCE